MRRILLIFIRNPIPGTVKTRLASTVGNEEALRIYHFLLEKTRQAALDCQAERWLYYSHFADEADSWPNEAFHKKVQSPGDLGARMASAFEQAFEAGANRALIIGSDCPELDGALLNSAFDALDEADGVLGPANDGGYYLLGVKKMHPELFQDMPWSTESVGPETLRRMAAKGLSVHLLPELTDVDTEEDWIKRIRR
ncbi:MAG: TIGR04282 family arsenosugar biosynthesis glycosyltransferase [Chitinophagales bacterium]|nr:TIGR04282 family arsenosugar biosynthesis glycosyltransferase [Chitinophagales bacterium]